MKKKKFQAVIFYHASMMDEYKPIMSQDFNTKKDAVKWIQEECEKLYGWDTDQENPLSDLYYDEINEIEVED